MPSTATQIDTLRDLARQYLDVCHRPHQQELRERWRMLNSLVDGPALIHCRAFAWGEVRPAEWTCGDQDLRRVEQVLRRELYRASLGDDTIFEPWLSVPAVHACTGWGVEIPKHRSETSGGSWKVDYPLKNLADIERLRMPRHDIDEEATARRHERVAEAVGDVIPVYVDRGPAYAAHCDISNQMGMLRGIENFMLDMYDNPQWLHRLAAFLRDGILAAHDQAEDAGDFNRANGINQSMTYSRELPDPHAGIDGAERCDLWWFLSAQEFTLVSPELHEEFLLQYQRPILERFGLVSYGCCEDLSEKVDMLRQIPNLRRIACSPMANVARIAEQVGRDYVISYRPSPTDMVGYGWDPERVRRLLREDLAVLAGTRFEVNLKDCETVQGDAGRVRKWVTLVREELDRAGLA